MEVTSPPSDLSGGGACKDNNQSQCISSQPTANGRPAQNSTEEAPPPLSDRSEDGDLSDDSVTGASSSTNDVSRLLPSNHVASAPRKQKGVDTSTTSPGPICSPPSSSSTCNRHDSLHPPPPPHPHRPPHQRTNQNGLSSAQSHASFKSDAAHIKEVAGDDCCVHCVLACLFCELLSLCSALGECVSCGGGGADCCEGGGGGSPCCCCCCCCCCMEAAGEAACSEEACQAALDCGMMEDCCGSSDCLDVCLECCSICFPS